MAFYQDHLDSFDQNNNSNIKKNKGIISRMKRSLSTSGRPPAPIPLRLPSSSQQSVSSMSTLDSPSAMQRSFSPIPSNLSSPIPTTTTATSLSSTAMGNSHSTSYFGPSPTIHLSYETFASSSASSLSIQSFPADTLTSTRSSVRDTLSSTTSHKIPSSSSFTSLNVTKTEKLQVKSMFESRLIENEKVAMTKLVDAEPKTLVNKQKKPTKDVSYAPAPAMYWSCPEMYGTRPPKLRAHASVVYNGKMFVYGGTSKNKCSDTLYVLELDTFTWSMPRVYGKVPPACRAHCLLANPSNGKIYLFGGGDGQKYHNHLYILDTHTMIWSRPKTLGQKPSERRAHITVLWQHAIYVFGGGDGTKALNDVHRLDLKTKEWTAIDTKGTKPTCRGYHTGTLVGSKLVIFGGSDGKECFGGIHVLDLKTSVWHPIHLDEQVPRLSHSAICVGSFLFVIAGHDVNMSWETRAVYGQAPTPCGYHTTVLYDSRIFLFGGYNGSSFSNDVYILDLSSYAYLPQIVNFTIDTF
ncbi:uncharacterized protein ATC70_008562 [Mucor velutinosus]|uniref:Uncharacterized protein n=1 Tax=Mucor velutinosus TaxID=708070 RepID=A0AAN7DN61_9FUNG|nr:hypothetical protein ATC70_008562 [Mucor velutinosus]